MSEPIAQTVYVSLGLALVTTGFGVFVERHFVSFWTIVFNGAGIASLALALNTSQIFEFVLLLAYAIAGFAFILWKRKFKRKNLLKHLFGSKIYGSIAVAYACNSIDNSNLARGYLNFLERSGFPKIFDNNVLAFSWMVIITSVLVAP
jgi:hypothetical protein